MGRELFIVSRDRADLYRYLTETFADAEGVQVIWDRRSSESGATPPATERRTHRTVDEELKLVGYAFIALD